MPEITRYDPSKSITRANLSAVPNEQLPDDSVAPISDKFQKSKQTKYPCAGDSYYDREFICYDPVTGEAVFYKTEEEMQAHQNEILERRKADLLLASSGSPESVSAINKSIRETKLSAGLKEDYVSLEEDKAAVINAAKTEGSSLTVAQLSVLAREYPELKSLADERISDARRRGVEDEISANMTLA